MKPDFAQILALLPQTQCTRCGYPDCEAYARAIAGDETDINQCPPGGAEGVSRLALLTGRANTPLNPENGHEAPRTVVFIDEAWCIGCTLCIDACPTDAIVGGNKRMHTVMEQHCTGCELCIPVCPVDCIVVENASGSRTGWQAWSQGQADAARTRYAASKARRTRQQAQHAEQQQQKAEAKLSDLAAHSHIEDPATLERKRALVQAAMERARARKSGTVPPADTDALPPSGS